MRTARIISYVAMCAGATALCAATGCQTTTSTTTPTTTSARAHDTGHTGDTAGAAATAAPFQNEKEARWQAAIKGLSFETGRVIVDTRATRDTAEAQHAFDRGMTAMQANDYVAAIGFFRDALAADATLAQVYEPLGDAAQGRGRTAWAIAAWRTALDLDTNNTDLRFKVASLLWQESQPNEAIAEMHRVLELNPASGEAYERLAVWQYYQNEPALAWKHVHAARALGRDVPPQFIPLLEAAMAEPKTDSSRREQ
ncbi:MAG: tetratricopeptide repeat protein [Phycisphaerales bacterium]